MKKHKMYVNLLVAVMLMLGTAAYAKEKINPDEMVEKLRTELNLTPNQVEDIKPIVKDHVEKKQELYSELKKVDQKYKDKLSSVLSPEQLNKYEQELSKELTYEEKTGSAG